MAVYVDPLQYYPRKPFGYQYWCHMWTDGDPGELHRLARKIGLKRSWYQTGQSVDHYDLTRYKRMAAIKAGAEALDFNRAGKMFAEISERKRGSSEPS